MKAQIKKETDDGFGVEVFDNNDVQHKIGVCHDGEIDGHLQDAYPDDPDDRTNVEGEHVSQATRYAQYYVAQETEYDTIPWKQDPEGFAAAREAILALSVEETEQFFGELFAQSLSHYVDHPDVDTGGVERPYELPADKIGAEGALQYKQEIYLDDDGEIEAVSGLLIEYNVGIDDRNTVRHGDGLDRDPDAQIEMNPAPLVAFDTFRDYLAYNLRCQVRDCYHGMGLEPPEEFKVLGPGQFLFTGKYHYFECYPEYFDHTADIPGYTHEFAPELPISNAEIGEIVNPNSSTSIYGQIKSALFSR